MQRTSACSVSYNKKVLFSFYFQLARSQSMKLLSTDMCGLDFKRYERVSVRLMFDK